MKRYALLLAATSFAMPAFAADVVFEEAPAPMAMPVEAAAPNWTGLYAGVQAGGAFNPSSGDDLGLRFNGFAGPIVSVPGGPDAFGDNFSSSFESGFIGGAHVGYDHQVGNFVFGALVDINALDVSQEQSAFSNTPAFYTAERSLDYLVTGRLKAGVTVAPTALLYATGGVAYGDVDYRFSTNSPAVAGANPPAVVNEDEDDFGYTVGGGMEVMFTENLSFGAEYLYTNLGGGDSSTRISGGPFDGNPGGVTPGNSTDFVSGGDFDFHTVTAKISYRFN